ncbi:MAG: PDZ domain-containing protein [Bacilli bacterium]|nr:PDZ domain-containing protein [Bacilli bacterium]
MFTKLYAEIKKILKENRIGICLFVLLLILFCIPLPYYIDTPGGAIDISKKIKLEDSYKKKGSLNFAYVSELKATPLIYLYAKFQEDWKIVKKEEVKYDNETIAEMEFRDKKLLEESYDNAVLVAYHQLGKEVHIEKTTLYITYLDEKARTDLEIGDALLKMDGEKITDKTSLLKKIRSKKAGEEITFKVKNKNTEYERHAIIIEEEGISLVGAMVTSNKDLKMNPPIEITSEKTESGPSGGLMLSLAIYNALTKEDITGGNKIVGTGTIEEDGTVGSIGGVAFKLKGAVKEKATLFLVPAGENYEEAIKLKKDKNYSIKIKAISTFEEALSYLKENRT